MVEPQGRDLQVRGWNPDPVSNFSLEIRRDYEKINKLEDIEILKTATSLDILNDVINAGTEPAFTKALQKILS